MTKRTIRWGILGCGGIAINRVMPAMLGVEAAEISAVASRSMEKAQAVAKQFGAKASYGSYEVMLADPVLDAIYIPLPNSLHKHWAIAAVRAGKHVLCEKPLGMTAAEARQMQAAAQKSERYLVEAFMYRFSPLMQKALQIIGDGVLGELRAIHTVFHFLWSGDSNNIRLQPALGGGALYDAGAYCINVQRMLAGREPRTAWARLHRSAEYQVDVGDVGVLDFGDQLQGTFYTGFNALWDTYFRVSGTLGILEAPVGFLGRERDAHLVLTSGRDPAEVAAEPPPASHVIDRTRSQRIEVDQLDPYALEIEDMCAAIRGERQLLFGSEPLDANMRVIDACFASDKAGRAVVV